MLLHTSHMCDISSMVHTPCIQHGVYVLYPHEHWYYVWSIHQLVYTFLRMVCTWNHPNFPRSLGHRPKPRAILILSNSLESAREPYGIFERGLLHITTKTIWQTRHDPGSRSVTRGHWKYWNQCALLLERSVCHIINLAPWSICCTRVTHMWHILYDVIKGLPGWGCFLPTGFHWIAEPLLILET